MKTLLFILLTYVASGQIIGIENDMLDIPDGYQLYKQDTAKAIMLISSNAWSEDDDWAGIAEKMDGYVVKCYYRFNGRVIGRFGRIKFTKQLYLDHNKIELKNTIIWAVSEDIQTDKN